MLDKHRILSLFPKSLNKFNKTRALCLLMLPWCVESEGLVLGLLSSFSFFHLVEEERAGCFAIIVFLLPCGCLCSVPLPHGAMGWSVVCECDFS